jgi:hypothetical protein
MRKVLVLFLVGIFLLVFGCISIGPDLNKISSFNVESISDLGTEGIEGNLVFYLRFYTEDGSPLVSEGSANLPAKITVYTSKYAEDGKTRIPDRLLYSGEHIIKNLQRVGNLNPNEDHLLVPRSQLGPILDGDLTYGVAVVEITLPDGKVLTDNAYLVKLKVQ